MIKQYSFLYGKWVRESIDLFLTLTCMLHLNSRNLVWISLISDMSTNSPGTNTMNSPKFKVFYQNWNFGMTGGTEFQRQVVLNFIDKWLVVSLNIWRNVYCGRMATLFAASLQFLGSFICINLYLISSHVCGMEVYMVVWNVVLFSAYTTTILLMYVKHLLLLFLFLTNWKLLLVLLTNWKLLFVLLTNWKLIFVLLTNWRTCVSIF